MGAVNAKGGEKEQGLERQLRMLCEAASRTWLVRNTTHIPWGNIYTAIELEEKMGTGYFLGRRAGQQK